MTVAGIGRQSFTKGSWFVFTLIGWSCCSNKREVFRPKSDEDSSRVGDTTSEDDDAFPVSSFRHLISGYGVADASWTTSANRGVVTCRSFFA